MAQTTFAPPQSVPLTDDQVSRLREAMIGTFFSQFDKGFPETPEGEGAVLAQTVGRFCECMGFVVPWVARHINLSPAHILEIGCGAGASTAAFAQVCSHIDGYDIDPCGLEGAR